MKEEIHHYCSPVVFLSFFKTRELWLTSLVNSNDKLEGLWLRDRWLDSFDERDDLQLSVKDFADRGLYLALVENVALGTCFSEARDLLSQWRGYADDGRGFSITFDRKALSKAASKVKNSAQITLDRIFYGGRDVSEISKIEGELVQAFRTDKMLEAAGSSEVSQAKAAMAMWKMTQDKTLIQGPQKDAAKRLFTVKNGAFHEEKEWRLLLFDEFSNLGDVSYREARSVLSPYVKFKVPKEAILGITMGPTCQTHSWVVENLVWSETPNVFIKRSSASYRNS